MPGLPTDLKNTSGKPSEPVQLAASRKLELRDASGYKPDDELVDAIKVALVLRKPLLLTGEPGTGKTDLGRYLAWKSGFLFFQFEAKSNSVSRDLYYHYDSLGRFQATQSGEKTEAQSFLRFHALGEAILQSRAKESLDDRVVGLLPSDFKHQGPRQSVVVIDEIDKAPRDFPNDLLNELEHNFFRMPELGVGRVTAGESLEPILVITSNSEKNLPAPFLRRTQRSSSGGTY
jgi:MoxR-like ATPase